MGELLETMRTFKPHAGHHNKSFKIPQIAVLALCSALLVQPLSIALPTTALAESTASTQGQGTQSVEQLTKLGEEIITSGAKLSSYRWLSKPEAGAEESLVHVIEVDLTNPYVKLGVMNGKSGSVTGVSSVGSMAKNSGAVAGVNADFFIPSGKGVPMGGQVNDGVLLVSPTSPAQLKGMYALAVTTDGKPVIDNFDFNGKITALTELFFRLRV